MVMNQRSTKETQDEHLTLDINRELQINRKLITIENDHHRE